MIVWCRGDICDIEVTCVKLVSVDVEKDEEGGRKWEKQKGVMEKKKKEKGKSIKEENRERRKV